MKLNHRQEVALRLAQLVEPHWIDSADLSRELWRDAHERGDEAEIWKMRHAGGRGSGYGRTLSWLASKGLLERRFDGPMAHFEYAITQEGKDALEGATP